MTEAVLFYRPYGQFGLFSNFFRGRPFKIFTKNSLLSCFIDKPVAQCFCAEMGLMLCKAAIFADDCTYQKILRAKTPWECKLLGRQVADFCQDTWDDFAEMFMFEILKTKFMTDHRLLEILMGTQDRIIAEASPTDRIWGIGLALDDENAKDPTKFRGRNLLGNSLMKVREHVLSLSESKLAEELSAMQISQMERLV